jgi:hypothetical protein
MNGIETPPAGTRENTHFSGSIPLAGTKLHFSEIRIIRVSAIPLRIVEIRWPGNVRCEKRKTYSSKWPPRGLLNVEKLKAGATWFAAESNLLPIQRTFASISRPFFSLRPL